MKKYIIGLLIIVFLIAGCFYFVFSRDETLTITYIRFSVNPDFVIGINNKDQVVMYNPLNDDANLFNLGMFNNKSVEEVTNIFLDVVNKNNYLVDKEVNLTIMTKNLVKRKRFAEMIISVIKRTNNSIKINILEPTSEELFAYSNEEVFDVIPSFNENDLKYIAMDYQKQIDLYVKNKINNLKLDKLNLSEQKVIIENSLLNGYFSDFLIDSVLLNYDIFPSSRTNYQVVFNFDEDLTYSYNIFLDLEFDYYKKIQDNEKNIGVVEVYEYSFDTNDELMSNYINHFYRFNY